MSTTSFEKILHIMQNAHDVHARSLIRLQFAGEVFYRRGHVEIWLTRSRCEASLERLHMKTDSGRLGCWIELSEGSSALLLEHVAKFLEPLEQEIAPAIEKLNREREEQSIVERKKIEEDESRVIDAISKILSK